MTHDDDAGRRLTGLFTVVAAVVCFSVSFSVIKWPKTPGSVIAWWRLIGSSILWWGLLLVRRARHGTPLPSRDVWRRMVVPGLFFGLNISIVFTAVTHTSVAHAEFIGAMTPLLTMPLGFVLFRERPDWRSLGWGLLAVAGIVFVLFRGPAKGVATVRGDLLAALGAASFAAYLLASKRARAGGVGTWDFMSVLMPVALITASPVALVTADGRVWPLSWKAWVAVAILSVLTGMVAHGFLAFAHQRVPIATMSTIQVSQPALSVMWAWILLGETITPAQVLGMALVMLGLALVLWFSQRAVPRRTVPA